MEKRTRMVMSASSSCLSQNRNHADRPECEPLFEKLRRAPQAKRRLGQEIRFWSWRPSRLQPCELSDERRRPGSAAILRVRFLVVMRVGLDIRPYAANQDGAILVGVRGEQFAAPLFEFTG